MKQLTLVFMVALTAMGLSAEGKNDQLGPRGPWDGEPREILVVQGTLVEGEYGHWEVQQGEVHYLLPPVMSPEEAEAYLNRSVELEGFAGPVLFTKGDESYQVFRPLKASVEGQELDLERGPMAGAPRGAGNPRGRGRHRMDGPCGGNPQDCPFQDGEVPSGRNRR